MMLLDRSRLGLIIIVLSLLVWSAPIALASTNALSSQLEQLELKFFQHQFQKESTEARLERLEKLVFGGTKTGSVDQRVQALLLSIPPTRSSDQTKPSTSKNNVEEPTTSSTNYPAISAIEKKILGSEYTKETVGQRLDRLEIKIFGHKSNASDLQDRLEDLKKITGIDVSKPVTATSDWVDEDEFEYVPVKPSVKSSGEDGKSFSGYDLRKDMQRVFGASNNTQIPSSQMANSYKMSKKKNYANLDDLVPDPQTGLLVDPNTGNVVDPQTGVVIGQRPGMGSGSTANGFDPGGFGSFNSGFASLGAPYGMSSGNNIRYGFGGIGRYGWGFWP